MRRAIAVLLGAVIVLGTRHGMAQYGAVGQAPKVEMIAPAPPSSAPQAEETRPSEQTASPATAPPAPPAAAPPVVAPPAPPVQASPTPPASERRVPPAAPAAAVPERQPRATDAPIPATTRPQPQPAVPQPPIARGGPGAPQAGSQGGSRGEAAGQAPPSADLANAPDPAIVADAFYRTYLAMRSPGVPDARQRARLRPFLSTSLDAELEAAEKAEQLYRAKTNGAVPPLVEGDLFSSFFEGPTEISVGDCAAAPPFVQCALKMVYSEPNTRQRVQWQDVLVLARQRGHWRVHDMTYQGEFGLGRHGTLLGFLRIVVKEARE